MATLKKEASRHKGCLLSVRKNLCCSLRCCKIQIPHLCVMAHSSYEVELQRRSDELARLKAALVEAQEHYPTSA